MGGRCRRESGFRGCLPAAAFGEQSGMRGGGGDGGCGRATAALSTGVRWRIWRLVTVPGLRALFPMPTATKLSPKKPARKVAGAKKKLPAHGIKAAPGNPFAGLKHVIGSITLPPEPRSPREIIRARILADYYT